MSASSGTILDRILAETREAVERRRAQSPLPEPAAPRPRRHRFREALAAPGIAVIAEFKRRSPSAGELRGGAELEEVLAAYERGGAAAMSILTEEANFAGSLTDLGRARELTDVPLLRKDFVVDRYQLLEARHAGADAVLLIVAALGDEQLRDLHAAAAELDLDVLVEVHDEPELERAKAAGALIVGVNNRDLRDFSVDISRTERLLGAMPAGAIVVSESGISTPAQLGRLQQLGVHAVLVGETLMRAPDPAGALRDLLAV